MCKKAKDLIFLDLYTAREHLSVASVEIKFTVIFNSSEWNKSSWKTGAQDKRGATQIFTPSFIQKLKKGQNYYSNLHLPKLGNNINLSFYNVKEGEKARSYVSIPKDQTIQETVSVQMVNAGGKKVGIATLAISYNEKAFTTLVKELNTKKN